VIVIGNYRKRVCALIGTSILLLFHSTLTPHPLAHVMTQPHNVDGDVLDISQIEEPTFTVVDEEEEREVRKKPSHLTIEVRNPEEKRELQPWDLVDPPADEEKYGTTSTATAYAPSSSSPQREGPLFLPILQWWKACAHP